jgi:hypothetical protein
MIGAVIMHQRQPGPCVICGDTDYDLSCGGPTICPKCDCGNFDSATVMKQANVIADLRHQLEVLCSDRTAPVLGAGAREEREDELIKVLEAYEAAIDEAEAIFGGEYGDHYGPMFDLAMKARDARRAALADTVTDTAQGQPEITKGVRP